MSLDSERQLPLNFSGTLKLTQDWYSLYANIHEILELNPGILELVHFDLTKGLKTLKRNCFGFASECILRLAIVQQIEALSFRDIIVHADDSSMLRFFCRFYDDPMISHSKYATLVNLITPKTWEKINEIIVCSRGINAGSKGRSCALTPPQPRQTFIIPRIPRY